MPPAKKNTSTRLPTVEAVLHAVLLRQDAAMPLTPAEVAADDARRCDAPPAAEISWPTPSPWFSWERPPAPAVDNVVAFRAASPPLAFAARAPAAVSPETRTQLGELIDEMKREAP